MEVVTFLSDINNIGFKECLLPSCTYFNLNFKVFESHKWNSNRHRDEILMKYLDSLDNEETILVTDAYDTFFLSEENEIIEKFKKFNRDIVFSAEMNCWPISEFSNRYPKSESRFKYLNGGAFIAKKGALMDCISSYYKNALDRVDSDFPDYKWSNQIIWTLIYLTSDCIDLDNNCEIFYSASSEKMNIKFPGVPLDHNFYQIDELLRLKKEILIKSGRVIIKETGTSPCHIHFNGVARKHIMHATYWDNIKKWK